jgi:hypothetical protein
VALGEEAFAAAWRAGWEQTVETFIREALQDASADEAAP